MSAPRVSLPRLRQRLESLASIGRDPNGGLTRLPFSPSHVQAAQLTAQIMAEAGLDVGVDEFGILIGQRSGDGHSSAFMVGSHLDTVPQGGMFDGALGVIAGIECAQALRDAGRRLRHRLLVAAFPDEEGFAFGVGMLSSRALVGEVPRTRFSSLRDLAGRSLADYLDSREHGLPAARLPEHISAYLELHIEQGPVLEHMGRRVAAVELITGIVRSTLTLEGRAGHAGTTPMRARADALAGAAEVVLAVRDLALRTDGRAVGTVGRLDVSPGAANVIPGQVRLSVELRSPHIDVLENLRTSVERTSAEVAMRHSLAASFDTWSDAAPQPLDPEVVQAILRVMQSRGHEPLALPSWAGHDAGILARFIPAGMIFVPSTGGLSHCPDERTPWPDIEEGTQVLLETLIALDAAADREARLPLAYAGA